MKYTVLESKNTHKVPPGGYKEPAHWPHDPGSHLSWPLWTPWRVWTSLCVSLGFCVPRSPTPAESARIFSVMRREHRCKAVHRSTCRTLLCPFPTSFTPCFPLLLPALPPRASALTWWLGRPCKDPARVASSYCVRTLTPEGHSNISFLSYRHIALKTISGAQCSAHHGAFL